jgi:hypothetical protein
VLSFVGNVRLSPKIPCKILPIDSEHVFLFEEFSRGSPNTFHLVHWDLEERTCVVKDSKSNGAPFRITIDSTDRRRFVLVLFVEGEIQLKRGHFNESKIELDSQTKVLDIR